MHGEAHGSPGRRIDRVEPLLCWHPDMLPLNFSGLPKKRRGRRGKGDFGRQIKPVLKLSERKIVAVPKGNMRPNA